MLKQQHMTPALQSSTVFSCQPSIIAKHDAFIAGVPAGNIRLISKAVSDAPGSLPITFYPRMPGNSTLRPTEKAALQQHLMPSYFSAAQQFEVPVITSQQLLREALPDGSSIDLLKVDVEGEELAVLQGLDEEGWQRVQQVVAEVHDCLPGGWGSWVKLH
jgi:FkbM family methyltransferase